MNRSVRKALIRKLRSLKKEEKRVHKDVVDTKQRVEEIKDLICASHMFNMEEAMEKYPTMNIEDFMKTKVWIVTEHRGKTILATGFFDFVRNIEKPKIISFDGLAKELIGPDGKKVNVEVGALIAIHHGKLEEKHIFHIANLGPGDEKGKLQYQYALNKLGIGMKTYVDSILLETDGQFRELLTGDKKGEN